MCEMTWTQERKQDWYCTRCGLMSYLRRKGHGNTVPRYVCQVQVEYAVLIPHAVARNHGPNLHKSRTCRIKHFDIMKDTLMPEVTCHISHVTGLGYRDSRVSWALYV